MTNEEAKNLIAFDMTQTCIRECQSHRGAWSECDFCKTALACDKAIEALEKQTPKKPVREQCLNSIYYNLHCCVCNEHLLFDPFELDEPPYCPFCGQAVDWSEYDCRN